MANALGEDTSIHWHGINLLYQMDRVPGLSFPGVAPETTFEYRFPLHQHGTYWYHSHSGLQEQLGVYGPLVVRRRDGHAVKADRDHVVMLSDWTFEDPHRLLARLRKHRDYYNCRQTTLRDILALPEGARGDAWREKLAWNRMRMMASDIVNVNGNTYTCQMNGRHPAGTWTGLFRPGERVRLHLVNGSAMSIFNVRVPGVAMTVTAADGQDVQPVELQIAKAGNLRCDR